MIFGVYLSSREERAAELLPVPSWFHRPVKLTSDVVVGRTRNPLEPEPEAATSTSAGWFTVTLLGSVRDTAQWLHFFKGCGFQFHSGRCSECRMWIDRWMDRWMDGLGCKETSDSDLA